MSSSEDKSGFEVFCIIIGALVLIGGVEAGTWYVAHQLAWWTFTLTMGAGVIFWQVVKQSAKAIRERRSKTRAARSLAARLLAANKSGGRLS